MPKLKSVTHRAIHEYNVNSQNRFLMASNIICPFKEPFVHTEMYFYCTALSNYELNMGDKNQY